MTCASLEGIKAASVSSTKLDVLSSGVGDCSSRRCEPDSGSKPAQISEPFSNHQIESYLCQNAYSLASRHFYSLRSRVAKQAIGSGFKSVSAIHPVLEPTADGKTSLWARRSALEHNCIVSAGYLETIDIWSTWPTTVEYYSSVVVVNSDGETISNYRKSFVYPPDTRWALKGKDGLFCKEIDGLDNVAMGIGKCPAQPFEIK
jgi:hypothetical protein